MFIQPCFIRKNNQYLRDKLKDLGYKVKFSANSGCIATGPKMAVNIPENAFDTKNPYATWNCAGRIDCGVNENLFLAIAALNDDDSDYMQWFCNKDKTIWRQNTCKNLSFIEYYTYFTRNMNMLALVEDFHKATVEEIVEHFK